MQPYHPVQLFEAGEDGFESRVVERNALNVREDLGAERVEVGQRIVEMTDPLSVVTKLRAWNAFEVPLELLQVAPWKDMRERIDHAHRRPLHPHASPNRTGGLVGQVMAGTLGSSSIAASIRDCDSSMSSSLPAK